MKNKIFLISILLISAFLRLYKLGALPNSYTPDEMAQGYTAYSILSTGKDEWGSSNLFLLRSFGDYKPILQTFLMVPSIKIFGLTPFAVRLPNAIFSVLTTLVIYFLGKNIFKSQKIGLLSSLIFALSSWSISMSRIALEANLLIFIISLSLLLFVKYVNSQKNIYLIFSGLTYGISLFTYHSAKIFAPLFIIISVIIFYKKFKKISLILFLLIFGALFAFNSFVNKQIKSARTNDIVIFNPTDNWQSLSNDQYEINSNGSPHLLTRSFFNKLTYTANLFLKNYLSYFSPQFLITSGAGETTYGMIPDFGVIGLIPFIGFIYVLYLLVSQKKLESKQFLYLLFLGLLISPVAASFAKGNYSGNRTSIMIPFFCLISAYGLFCIFNLLKSNFIGKIGISLISLLFMFFSFSFIEKYFFQANQILAQGMLYGRQQAIEYLNTQSSDQIIFSRKLSEPQAYITFFNQINPKITQSESKSWLNYELENHSFLDQLGTYKLKNYVFKEINFPSDSQLHNAILVGKPEEFNDAIPDKIIYFPSKVKPEPAIYIYHTKQ